MICGVNILGLENIASQQRLTRKGQAVTERCQPLRAEPTDLDNPFQWRQQVIQ